MNITYKITVEKGWHSWERIVFKTFYFKDFAYANDFLFRLQRNQNIGFRRLGKFQMQQILNSDKKPTVKTYREYAKLVLDLGMAGDQHSSLQRFSAMIDRIIEENSTPVIYKRFKKDYNTRIWFSDVIERKYPRSTRFLNKEQKEQILQGVK